MAPKTGKRVLVINAPRGFATTWNVVKHYLVYPHTAALVHIVPKDQTLATLQKHMDDSIIPACLGGTKCVDGDAECRKLLAPGGQPPLAIFEKLHDLIAKEQKGPPKCDGNGFNETKP